MNVWAYNVRGSLEWKATTDKEQAKKMAESPRFEVRSTREAEPAAPVDARDALTANRDAWMAQAQALAQAAGQASFCLRTLVPDDPDAQMTVRMLNAALAAPPTAATREPAAPVDARDALRLDWIARQGDEFVSGIIVDRPGDGDYYVYGCGNIAGTGATFLDALDDAIADAAFARRSAIASQAAAPAEGSGSSTYRRPRSG